MAFFSRKNGQLKKMRVSSWRLWVAISRHRKPFPFHPLSITDGGDLRAKGMGARLPSPAPFWWSNALDQFFGGKVKD